MNVARLASARALISIERGRTTLAAETERERKDIASSRDRALFLEITAGTTRWRAELDACIAAHSRRAIEKLTPEVRAVLRSGAYQLLHLDRVPAHAAVSESVDAIRALGQAKAASFVNAVLRKLTLPSARRTLPRRPSDGANTAQVLDYLSISLSHPRWLVERWVKRLGFEAAERWCFFNNSAPAITVRPLPPITSHELIAGLEESGIDTTAARHAPGAFLLPPGGLGRIPASLRDRLAVQDEGSILVARAADVQGGDRVLDLCAAPGGKTLVLAEAAGDSGKVVASDLRPARVTLLASLLRRANAHVTVVTLDATTTLPFGAVFDRVVLDAPCSGVGTLRRDPDLKWSRQETDLTVLVTTQLKMIEHAASVIRPGGHLLYATCSSEPEENEQIVDAFLANAPGFAIERVASAIDDSLVTSRGFLQTIPPRDRLDAFFAANLVRSGSA